MAAPVLALAAVGGVAAKAVGAKVLTGALIGATVGSGIAQSQATKQAAKMQTQAIQQQTAAAQQVVQQQEAEQARSRITRERQLRSALQPQRSLFDVLGARQNGGMRSTLG